MSDVPQRDTRHRDRATHAFRVLICSPVDGLLGGIPAAVRGLITGLQMQTGVQVLRIPYGRSLEPRSPIHRLLHELGRIPLFLRALARFRPHVVQIESAFDRKTLVRDSIFVWLAHLLRYPVLVRSHGGLFDEIPTWHPLFRWWATHFILSCDSVVVLARDTLEDAIRLFGPRPSFAVCPNAVEIPGHILPSGRTPRPDEEIAVVSAGRLVREKGVDDIVHAMSYVTDTRVRLYIFGDGPLVTELRAIIQNNTLAAKVKMMGVVTEDDLLEFFSSRADMFVFPSYPKEGFPMAFFSAVGCGLPVICTRVRPIPDYLREPDNCLWVRPRDPVDIAHQVDRLASDPQLRLTQSTNNALVVGQFAPVLVARKFLSIYESLVSRERIAPIPASNDR